MGTTEHALRDATGRALVPVLTYHAVTDEPPDAIRRFAVTPARLQEHLAALRAVGAEGLTVGALLACYRGDRPLPARPVVLTFDDGYEDFLHAALPALAAAGYPATLYASTGLLRDERPAVVAPPGRMLSWAQLAEIAEAGVEVGAHGHTHRALDTLPRAEAVWEVTHSRERIQQELGRPVDTVAYPYGYATAHLLAAVRAEGFVGGCGVRNAYSHAGEDPVALSRLLVEHDLDAAALTRLVTERVAPVGWAGERVRTRAWRGYRRARALHATLAGTSDVPAPVAVRAPTAVREVELAAPLPALTGPAHVLARVHGRPVGAVLVEPGDTVSDVLRDRLGPFTTARPATGPPPAAPPVSVVIPTVGRPELVDALVRSLCEGDVAPEEIIVVDNRPADPRTRAAFAADPRVRYLAEPVPGASRARNRGLAEARCPAVAFLDDDVVVDRGWLRAVREAWGAAPGVGAVTGLILPAALDTAAQLLVQAYGGFDKGFTRRVFDLGANRLAHPLYPYLVGAYGSGANAVFDRARLRALGGFDERLGPGTRTRSGEDLDVLLRTVLAGTPLVYEPAALVRHHHRADYADLRRMAFDYGVGLGALIVKHVVAHPLEVGRRLPAGLHLLLGPRSRRNANRREAAYPAELTVRELVGVATGPLAYAVTSGRGRRPSRSAPVVQEKAGSAK